MPLNLVQKIHIPEGVEVSIARRIVTVTGPRGTLKRDFKKAEVDFEHNKEERTISITVWFPRGPEKAIPRTVATHIENLFTGVTKGYEYHMRFAYAHFPISAIVSENNTVIEIKNFMHQIRPRRITCPAGVKVALGTEIKDEIILTGNDIEDVSHTAARLHECMRVPDKDLRKFLDGCYISQRTTVVK